MKKLWPAKPRWTDPKLIEKFDLVDWVVQPKWDGKRILLTQSGGFSRFWRPLHEVRLSHDSLIDGELCKNGDIIVWDVAISRGKNVFHLPYSQRLEILKSLPLPKGVTLIETRRAKFWRSLWLRVGKDAEGLVFKQVSATDWWGSKTVEVFSQLKWRK